MNNTHLIPILTKLCIIFGALASLTVPPPLGAQLPPGVVCYTINRPLQDGMTLRFRDYEQSGGFNVSFSNLTANVYLDTVNATVRVLGYVSVSQNTNSTTYTATRSVPQTFPNPPIQVTGTVTVGLALQNSGLFFDTGYRNLSWEPSIGQYGFDGTVLTTIPVVGSYRLVTGGTTYGGQFSYQLGAQLGAALTFTRLSTLNYPASISLSAMGYTGGMFSYAAGTSSAAQVTASNGFPVNIQPGLPMWGLFNGESFNWSFGAQQQISGGAGIDYTPVAAVPGEVPLVPAIISQPTNAVVLRGQSASFRVVASGQNPLLYQWRFSGTNILDATNALLTLNNVQTNQSGPYTVVVSNGFGSLTSAAANLTVQLPPTPAVGIGRAVRLTFTALQTGTAYQLQASQDLRTWSNVGAPFIATSSTNSQYLDVDDWSTCWRLSLVQ